MKIFKDIWLGVLAGLALSIVAVSVATITATFACVLSPYCS